MKKRKKSDAPNLVALLTDFGSNDWFPASMKGVIKRIAPCADVVDVTHNVERHNINSASFILESCYRDFPEGTVFCCVVDPGVGTPRKRLAATDGAYFFVAPDNGLLTSVESSSQRFSCYSIENPLFRIKGAGATFDGRDIFAPAAAHLASGVPIHQFGPIHPNIIRLSLFEKPAFKKQVLEGRILHVDSFGNLITNITPGDLNKKWNESRLTITIKRKKIHGLANAYGEVKKGTLLTYWGSTGRLEIAINQGNAAKASGVLVGESFLLSPEKFEV